jgi:hypothetical protein
VSEFPAYVVLGRGRWAGKIQSILSSENRRVVAVSDTRPRRGESESEFKGRLRSSLAASRAELAWLCDSPGLNTRWMIESAMQAGLHAIVEKPWLFSPAETRSLKKQAEAVGLILGVHYEYCMLDAVENWKRDFSPGSGLRFGGRFAIKNPGSSRIAAIENLGCHLFSIHQYAVPSSEVAEIHCGYELPDERLVWIEKGRQQLARINFGRNKEPIVQRFIKKVEAALEGAAFPFDLDFALGVAQQLETVNSKSLR